MPKEMIRFVLFDALFVTREVSYFEKFKCKATPCTEPMAARFIEISESQIEQFCFYFLE